MLKKAVAAQHTAHLKEQLDKLSQRLARNVDEIENLMKATQVPQYTAVPDQSVLQNLIAEVEDSDFWQNFKKAAPILFCSAIEHDVGLKQVRDMSFIEELLKTKSLMRLMKDKVDKGEGDIDIVEYSIATKTLETKLKVLQALNIHVESGDDQNKITLNVAGSGKAIQIDLVKLRESITVLDKQVVEKQASPDDIKPLVEHIDLDCISEEDFLNKAVENIGTIQKTPQKTLTKDCFIKIFKYTGDFAKLKSREAKAKAQENRCKEFGGDPKKYLLALKSTVAEEEKAYEKSSMEMFERLCITPEFFERSQQELMMDPYVSMELFNMGISMEQPNSKAPEELTAAKTVELVKASNTYAFDLFKKEYLDQMRYDPMIMPVLISAIAHDWVFKNHNFTEEQFKAALFAHKIYEDPEVAMHMQQKQMELLQLSGGFNPMMMGGGMGGPGGIPPSLFGPAGI
jgi:hypothetical protein